MMRVMHVLEATLGGTRRYLEDIAKVASNFENVLVYSRAREDAQFPALLVTLRALGWSLHEISMSRSISLRKDYEALTRLAHLIRDVKPDLIHAHSSKGGALARLAALRSLRRIPVVYSPHSTAAAHRRSFHLIELLLSRLTGRFCAVTESEREQIVDLGLASTSIVDIVNPIIDGHQFVPRGQQEAKRALGFDGSPLLLAVGRLSSQKDPVRFLRVVHLLRSHVPGICGIWLGDGELRTLLEAKITQYSAANWFFVAGWQSDVQQYIEAADLVVSVSRYESFGYATAEALASERVVVASRIGGTSDILVDELADLMFDLNDDSACISLVKELLVNDRRRARLAALGRQSVLARFSVNAMRSRLETCYRHALGAGLT